MAALLVVIAVEVTVTSFRGLDLKAADAKTGLVAGCASLVATVAALSPSLPDSLYEVLFAAGVAGALTALLTVIIVAVRAIDEAAREAHIVALRRRARLSQDDARVELLELGEQPPEPLIPNPGRQDSPARPVDG